MRAEAQRLCPEGPGALAVIRVQGPDACAVLERLAGGRLPLSGALSLRDLRGPDGATDQVVVANLGADRFELTGHAGPAVVRRTLEALEAAGATVCPPPPASRLARARTLLAARVAGWVEAGSVDPAREPARSILERLLTPPRVALYGAPNAGKSTLLNALLERDRAITSPHAGTTRDVLEEETAFLGVPVRLADTAGQGPAKADALERAGAERAEQAARRAEVRVLVLDGSCPLSASARRALSRSRPTLIVLQKHDLTPVLEPGRAGVPDAAIPVSAKTGAGLEALRIAIARAALGADPRAMTGPAWFREEEERCG